MPENEYKLWLDNVTDASLLGELKSISNNKNEINERFYKKLSFGTAGLRGIIGAGTNRMNTYTVGQATKGLAEYIKTVTKCGKVAIAYDSRHKSEEFAKHAASVLSENGIKVYIYKELMPTPMLSFAVRYLKCDAGIVITASHNPAKYNGYKAYGNDGCQLGLKESEIVTEFIDKTDIFSVKKDNFDEALKAGKIEYIENDVIEAYLDAVQACSCSDSNYKFNDLSVIYTPLHGAGNKPVRAIFKRLGIKNVTVVPEQEKPDGSFPTLPFPNPEFKEAFDLAIKIAKSNPADILIATDPDSDRVGAAIKNSNAENGYTLLSGNEAGALMLNYLLQRKKELNTLPKNPVAVKTIISTELCQMIADKYGCKLINVLTGFKFIGGQIKLLEEKGEENRFIFGFEESYGYLGGTYVRDKDAVIGSMLFCEMACYYKEKGLTLLDVLDNLYKEFGYIYNKQKSIVCEGQKGMENMANAMQSIRENIPQTIGGLKVTGTKDYSVSLEKDFIGNKELKIDLPKSNVITFILEKNCSVTVRPSGTEPKIKIYVSAFESTMEESKTLSDKIAESITGILNL